jgi:hypothetical protein
MFRHLFLDNPMNFETTRVLRRFFRVNGETTRGLNVAIVAVLLLLYAWILIAILCSREDMSAPLMMFEAVLLSLIVPASMYGAISGERERLTWDGLILTRLSAGRILAGKLLWRLLLIVFLMALFSVPLFLGHAICRFRPDYTTTDLVRAQVVVAAWSVLLAAFSLWVSAKTRRSVTTLALVATALLAFTLLIPILVGLFGGRVSLTFENVVPPTGTLYGSTHSDVSPMEYLGSILVHLHPLCGLMPSMVLGPNWDHDLLWLLGWGYFLPVIYLLGAIACLVGTLKTLRRLGMPNRLSR